MPEGRQARGDAARIGDGDVTAVTRERNVEIDTDKDAPILDVEIAHGKCFHERRIIRSHAKGCQRIARLAIIWYVKRNLLCLLSAVVWLASGIAGPGGPLAAAAAEEEAGAASSQAPGLVRLPSGHVLQVEIADTPPEIRRGYMFREKIADDEGMIFLLGQDDFHSFWMKNCKVPLDIIWLDEKWIVVHVERNLPPCTEDPCPSYLPMRSARYVLEMRGGLSEKVGPRLGEHIVFLPPIED